MTQRPEDLLAQKARDALDRIPGYRGYRLKEERRDADRRVRAAVADAYTVELARIERIGRDLANARRLGEIGDVERANQAIRHFIDRVRTVSPGYGGLFGDRDIDGVALDQLRLFDESLMLGLDELRPAIDRLVAASTSSEPLTGTANEIAALIETQLLRLNTRQDVIDTGAAAQGESALAALRPLADRQSPAAYAAVPGDAISILGDDYLVDALIDVSGRPRSFRLLRISRNPEQWLYVDQDPDHPMLQLRLAEAADAGLTLVDGAMRLQVAGAGDGEITAEEKPAELRAVRYALLEDASDPEAHGLVLDWDGERQAFAGERTETMDVEVFHRADGTE